jgi:hypothetical protein
MAFGTHVKRRTRAADGGLYPGLADIETKAGCEVYGGIGVPYSILICCPPAGCHNRSFYSLSLGGGIKLKRPRSRYGRGQTACS